MPRLDLLSLCSHAHRHVSASSFQPQAYTQRFQVDHRVSLVNQLARGVLSAEAAETDMAAYKVGGGACGSMRTAAWPTRRAGTRSSEPARTLAASYQPEYGASASMRSPLSLLYVQVEVPETPPTEAVLRVVPAVESRHPGAQVRRLCRDPCTCTNRSS